MSSVALMFSPSYLDKSLELRDKGENSSEHEMGRKYLVQYDNDSEVYEAATRFPMLYHTYTLDSCCPLPGPRSQPVA